MKELPRLLMLSVAFAAHIASPVVSQDLLDDCGAYSTQECLILAGALQRWNETFGETLRVNSFVYKGPADNERFWDVFGRESSSLTATIDQASGQLIVVPLRDIFDSVDNRFGPGHVSRNIENLISLREALPSAVQIEWSTPQGVVYTDALVGNQPPYVLDTMLNSVLLVTPVSREEVNAELCDEYEIKTFALLKTGEYSAIFEGRLLTNPQTGGQLSCALRQSHWTYWGFGSFSVPDTPPPISYGAAECETQAVVEFVPLFSTIKVERGRSGVEISDFGGGWRRVAQCRIEFRP